MSRRLIRGFVAKLGATTIRAVEGVDGLLILEPWPEPTGSGWLATVTEATWRWLPDTTTAFERFSAALRSFPTERIEVVLDDDLAAGGRQLQAHRDQFAGRRRRRVSNGPELAPVVELWVARQRHRTS